MSRLEWFLWGAALVFVFALTSCSGGQIALVVDGDGNMKQVACVEYTQPGVKAELICK